MYVAARDGMSMCSRVHPKKFSVLDAASTSLGGAVGAMATDKWILTPVAKSVNGTRYYGLASQYHF